MEAIPAEWIDKLFNCMEEFYGDRWKNSFNKPHMESFYKTMWKNGLMGLTYDQIKYELQRCKRHAQNPFAQPPIVTEFFQYAKHAGEPQINYHPDAGKRGNPDIARDHLAKVREKLTSSAS